MTEQSNGFEPLPPHNTEAEESVLGSMLMDPAAVEVVAPILKPDDFYHPRNRDVYAGIMRLVEGGQAADYVTIADELERADTLDRIGGQAYLIRLLGVVPTSIHAEHYAQIVKRTAISRRFISAAGRIAAAGYEDLDPAVLFEAAMREVTEAGAAARTNAGGAVRLGVLLREYLDEIQIGEAPAEEGTGRVPTGFIDLDRMLSGMARGDLIILAARPSLGKTALALNIARNVGVRFNLKAHVFSVEMAGKQIAQRFLSTESGVDSARIREGRLSETEIRKVGEALDVLDQADVWVDDMASIPLAELCTRARQVHAEQGTDLIIVDYLQLVSDRRMGFNKVNEVAEISKGLKGLARELNVPLLVLSQLSRAVESRTPHIPMLSDLRDSGSIEQDADVVLFLYREDVYDRETERRGITDVYVAKHRNGPTGVVSLFFREASTRFENLERHGEAY
jgi:replicative DNA helicase